VIRVPSLLGYDDVNSFLVIAWVFISAAFLFLGISYFTPLFSTGWPRLLLGLAGFVMLLTVVIEVIGR
jgi:hypothetical protein